MDPAGWQHQLRPVRCASSVAKNPVAGWHLFEAARSAAHAAPEYCNRVGGHSQLLSSASSALPQAFPLPPMTTLPPPYLQPDYGNTETEGIPPVDDMVQLLKDALDQRLQGGRTPLQASGAGGSRRQGLATGLGFALLGVVPASFRAQRCAD